MPIDTREILEMFVKVDVSMALTNLFTGARIEPDKLDLLDDIKNTLGMRVISALRLFVDCELNRNPGSLEKVKSNIQDLEFHLNSVTGAELSAIPPQCLQTESLRLIRVLCTSELSHLEFIQSPQAPTAATRMSELKEYAYSCVVSELRSATQDLTKAGVELNGVIAARLGFVEEVSTKKGDVNVTRDEAKHAAKAITDLFMEYNQVKEASQLPIVESLTSKLHTCFDRSTEKVAALAKQ